jgi:gas vesicle protein
MSGKNGWAETFSAFAVGVGVGTALGILFAPKAGEDLRSDLAGNAREGLDQAVSKGREWAGRAQKVAGDAVDQAKSQVRDAVDEGGQAYREARNSAS